MLRLLVALFYFFAVAASADEYRPPSGGAPTFVNAQGPGYATGNGITNDVAGLQAALAATPAGGTLFFPCGTYNVASSASQIFLITSAVNLIGNGQCVSFTGALGASTDFIHVQPGNGVLLKGMEFSNFILNTTGGQDYFHLDTNSPGYIQELQIDHIRNVNAPGRHVVNIDNPLSNATGGTFHSTFGPLNWFNTANGSGTNAGINCNYCGDTIVSFNNIITGNGWAYYVNQIAGAGQFISTGNNITACGGIYFDAAERPVLKYDEIEMAGTCSRSTGAVINLVGGINVIDDAQIDEQIQILSGASTFFEDISVVSAANTVISGRLAGQVSQYGVVVGSASSNTTIACGTLFVPGLAANTLNLSNVTLNQCAATPVGTPTIASNACGSTTQGTIAGGSTNASGVLTVGTTGVTSCTISFSGTLAAAPHACTLTPANSTASGSTGAYVSAMTTANFVITGTSLASASYNYQCN